MEKVIIPHVHPGLTDQTSQPLERFRAGLQSGIVFLEEYSPTNSVIVAERLAWLGWDDNQAVEAQVIIFPERRVNTVTSVITSSGGAKLYEGYFPASQ